MTFGLVYANEYVESLVPLPPWVPTPKNIRFNRARKTLDRLVYRIIDDRRKDAVDQGDLLGMLMAVQDADTKEKMSDKQLRDEIMTLVLAGHETTANALTWLWFLLSKHPDIARKLEAEVDAVLGTRLPTLEDLPKLAYTERVIKEAMRLFPPVWVFERQAIADDVVGGYRIPAGATIGSPQLWENPEGFDPDRFLASAPERPKMAYLPFGAGPRFCIGNAFAMMEAQLIVAMVVQRHRLALVPGHEVVVHPVTTLRPKDGVQVTLHRREPAVLTKEPACASDPISASPTPSKTAPASPSAPFGPTTARC
jgi:cytochrome P450